MSVKILNEELKRIHEIMGIKHNLIVESGGLGSTISKFSREYIETLISKLEFFKSNAGRQSDVIIGGSRFSQRDVTRAINILESGADIPTRYSNASQNVKNVIKATMSQDTEFSNLAYLELIRYLKNVSNLTEEELMKNIQDRMQQYVKSGRGGSVSPFDEFKRKFTTEWQDLLDIGEDAFKRQYSDFSESGKSFRPIQSQYTRTTGQGRILTDDELSQASKALRDERPKKFNIDFFNTLRKSINQVKSEIDEISKGYWDALSDNPEMSREEVEKLGRQYAVQIVRRLNILEAKENNAAVTALRDRDIPESIVDVIRNDSGEFFRLYRNVWGEVQLKSFINEFKLTTQRFWSDVKESFQVNETKGFRQWFNRFINVFNPKTKLGQFLLTDSFAAFDRQWQQMIKQSGAQKGNRTMYILTAAWLNSVGYVIGSTIKDVFSFAYDITLANYLNKFLPLDIGVEGEDPLYTIPKIDNEESMKVIKDAKEDWILAILKAFFRDLEELLNMFKEKGAWKTLKESSWLLFRRSLPMGLGTFGDSVDARLIEFLVPLDIKDVGDYMSLFAGLATEEVEVVAYRKDKNSFKKWYKDTYPDKLDDVRSYRMNNDDPNDIYFEVNMKGVNTADEFYKYDSDNSNFEKY